MTKTITRADIINEIVAELEASVDTASAVLESVVDTLCDALTNGRDVKISTFGKFCVNEKAERIGRNPKSGEEAIISARRVVSFRASAALKETVSK